MFDEVVDQISIEVSLGYSFSMIFVDSSVLLLQSMIVPKSQDDSWETYAEIRNQKEK
jgi:hypothetical protein